MVWADGSLSLLPLLSGVSSNFPRVYALLFLGISWPQVTLSKGPSVLPGKGKNEHGRGWLRNRCWIENFWSLLHRLPSGRHPVLPPTVPHAPNLRFWGGWFALFWCPHLQYLPLQLSLFFKSSDTMLFTGFPNICWHPSSDMLFHSYSLHDLLFFILLFLSF